ncbi:DJ-1/PfpI family protein [Burkholderia pseudomallei]|uniref:DJ-1/PfpI family protein n=1 Tax=Burkholderia pseudomallei TaxID=28450 RepID=UPI0005727060|nr:DJ-1/PfpI family protein [Burkholderia pseudomallei]
MRGDAHRRLAHFVFHHHFRKGRPMSATARRPLKTGFLLAPGVAVMDLFGAHAVFGFAPQSELHLLWKTREPISALPPFPIAATTTFADCPDELDAFVVGAVPADVIADDEVIAFVRRQASRARYVIGICGGVLLLGAAGLLNGRRATTNFHVLDALAEFGARPVGGGEVVIDGNLYTAGPATGGFEAALLVLAELRGAEAAKHVELTIEYHPRAPFGVGTPALAGPALTKEVLAAHAWFFDPCKDAARAAYGRGR